MVVISWDTITLLRGDQILKTMKTVQSLMNDLSTNCSVKFLYVITRPPLPPNNKYFDPQCDDEAEYCDSDRLAEKAFDHLNENLKKLTDECIEFSKKYEDDIKRLNNKTNDLNACKNVFDKLIDSFETHATSGWKVGVLKFIDNGFKIGISNAVVKQALMKDLKLGNDASNKEIPINNWVNDQLERLVDQILKELESKSDQKEKIKKIIDDVIKKETQQLDKEIKGCREEREEINKKLEEKASLVDFLTKIKADDIYIIRGFKLDNKWEDHKEKLLKRIEEICIQNNNQTDKASLRINGTSEQFSAVLKWAKEESKSCETMLNDVVEGIDKIEKLNTDINELDERIKGDENNLRLALVSSRENENEIIENLIKKISILKEKKEKIENELKQATNDINEMQKSIQAIRESPAIDFGSKTIVKKRNKVTRFFRFQTNYLYKFPTRQIKALLSGEEKSHNFPIERVEISCLVNKEEKIVFKTSLNFKSIMNKRLSNDTIVVSDDVKEKPFTRDERIKIISNGENTDFKSTGEIKIVDSDLNNGLLKIEYKSIEGKDGFAGFRCFVKPIHIPDYKLKINDLNEKIKEKRYLKLELEKTLEDVTKDIDENSDYLECLKKGLHDEQKGAHLLQLLLDLEYSLDEFIGILMQEIKEENIYARQDIEWLEKDANYVEMKKLYVNYDCINSMYSVPSDINMSKFSKNLFRDSVFDKNQDEINQEMENLTKQNRPIGNFDFYRLLSIMQKRYNFLCSTLFSEIVEK